jgi:hypothetical protein
MDRKPGGPKGHKTTSESTEKSRNNFTTQEEDSSSTSSREPSTSSKDKITLALSIFPESSEKIDLYFLLLSSKTQAT